MFVVFVGALTVFLIIGMLLAWVGNKILLSILNRQTAVIGGYAIGKAG